MPSRGGKGVLLGAAVIGLTSLAPVAQTQTAVDGYLRKMVLASTATYQSRQLVVYLGSPQQAAIVELRSTPDGRYLRSEHDGDVTRIWSDTRHRIVTEGSMAIEELAPSRPLLSLDALLAKYDVRAGVPSELLGVAIVPLELQRRSDGRFVERMWVQPDNGIVYRRELFGDGGKLVGMSTVLDMRWGTAERMEPYAGAKPARVLVTKDPGAPRALPQLYAQVGAWRLSAGGRPARHWAYSDGLHLLSVFRRDGDLRPPAGYTLTRSGRDVFWRGPGPGTWMWEGGGAVWTMVAEEPQLDPAELTRRFPHGGPSIACRMGAWWARGFHWVAGVLR